MTPDPPAAGGTPRATAVDEELSQAKARLAVSLFALVYVGLWTLLSGPVRPTIVWALLGYTAFSAAWMVLIRRRPGTVPWRRVLVIVGDLGINTLFLHLLQERGAFFYPMYLWIVVGNGMRYGARYLVLALVTAVFFFVPLLVFSPYWQANRVAGSGLLAGMVVLPLFYLVLIRRLHEANQRLAEEVERSQAAVRAKNEFLANMSHELRTPMNGVLGVADLLRLTDLSDEQRDYADLVERSASSLLRIIDDILDFARLEAGRITLQDVPFDIERVVHDVVDLLLPGAEEKGLLMAVAAPADARRDFVGDPTRIRQVLVNLVGNAIKFTERGRVDIGYGSEPAEDGKWQVRLAVSDTGVGIPEEQLDNIFEKFERAEMRLDHRFGGTGLGLAIGRHLARRMGGDITVASAPGSGSTFTATFLLEAAENPADPQPAARSLPADLRGLSALVVEDSEANLKVIRSFLEHLGMSCVAAADGEAAVARFRERPFDLVVMDMRLPVLDGLEATRRMRSEEGADRHVAIVALTANASRADEAACLEAGMDLFLAKPLRLADLADAIGVLRARGLIRPA